MPVWGEPALEIELQQPAWTYSQLDTFETCPKKFYHLKVAKDYVDPPSVHSEWGTRVHSAFEENLKEGTPLPEGMEHWQPIADKIAKLPGEKLCEHKLALDRNFQPAEWKNSWTRGIADVIVIHKDKAAVIDYKTGKRKPSEQLDLYANYVFAHFPAVEQVTTMFVWLKEKKVDKKPITRNCVPEIWQGILPRVAKLESAYKRDSWVARPSGLCRGWCPVTECPHNQSRK